MKDYKDEEDWEDVTSVDNFENDEELAEDAWGDSEDYSEEIEELTEEEKGIQGGLSLSKTTSSTSCIVDVSSYMDGVESAYLTANKCNAKCYKTSIPRKYRITRGKKGTVVFLVSGVKRKKYRGKTTATRVYRQYNIKFV